MLLLLQFLDSPFHPGVGGLRPVAMQRTLRIMDQELKIVDPVPIPCDAHGNPRRAELDRCWSPAADVDADPGPGVDAAAQVQRGAGVACP